MNKKIANSKLLKVIWLSVIFILFFFIVLPLFSIFLTPKASDFVKVLSSEVNKQTIINTLIECVCSSVLSVIVGFLYAYAVVYAKIPFKKFFSFVPLIHLITPPFVGGLAFILLLGRNGFILHTLLGLNVSLYGFWGLLIAQVLCFFPLSYLICLQSLKGINTEYARAAKAMGASRTRIFFKVTLPLCSTGILSSLLFIAVSVLSDFGNPLIVAGRFRVLAVEIYTQLTGWMNTSNSAVLGIVLVIPSVLLFYLQNRIAVKTGNKNVTIGGKSAFLSDTTSNSDLCSKGFTVFLFIFVIFIVIAVFAQFIAIIAGSVQQLWGIDTHFTLDHLCAVLKYSKELSNSLCYAFLSAIISTAFALLCVFLVYRTNLPCKNFITTFAQLPGAIPGSLLGLGFLIFFHSVGIKTGGFLIVVAMTFSFLPFSFKSIFSVFAQISSSMDQAAMTLGANSFTVLVKILSPLGAKGIFSGFIYAFIRGVGTVSAVIFLVSFNNPLASVKILNLAEEGFWGKSAALALILTLLTFAILGTGTLLLKIFSGVKKWKQH